MMPAATRLQQGVGLGQTLGCGGRQRRWSCLVSPARRSHTPDLLPSPPPPQCHQRTAPGHRSASRTAQNALSQSPSPTCLRGGQTRFP
eukprot:3730725-Rhodomonas_salina.2